MVPRNIILTKNLGTPIHSKHSPIKLNATLSHDISTGFKLIIEPNCAYISGQSGISFFPSRKLSTLPIIPGTILNRTYGTQKNLYISLFLPTISGPIYYDPP